MRFECYYNVDNNCTDNVDNVNNNNNFIITGIIRYMVVESRLLPMKSSTHSPRLVALFTKIGFPGVDRVQATK